MNVASPRALAFLSFVLAPLFLSPDAHGQILTGNILGTVKDESGAVLPGVSVTIASPALPAGPSHATTNEHGQFRFPTLPAGTYSLAVELSGFATYREEGLRVVVNGTIERNVVLKVATFAETVTVSGEAPVIDTKKSGVSTNYSQEFVDKTPVRRFSVFDLLNSAPGMTNTDPGKLSDRQSAFGSGTNENSYMLDGADITSPVHGQSWPWPEPDLIEEIEINAIGPSVEYGGVMGGVFNIISKSGGNEFSGDATYVAQPDWLASVPIVAPCDCPAGETGYIRDQYNDISAHLGGPIVKERLWFYGGLSILRDSDSQPGGDPQYPFNFETERYVYKINWQITPNLKLQHGFEMDTFYFPDDVTPLAPFETGSGEDGYTPVWNIANVTHLLSSETFYNFHISTWGVPDKYIPFGGYDAKGHLDAATGQASQGSRYSGFGKQRKTEFKGKLSHYASDFLNAEHDFKFGAQYIASTYEFTEGYPGGTWYLDYLSQPYIRYSLEQTFNGASSGTVALFAEDVLSVGERLNLSVGVRYAHDSVTSQDIDEFNTAGEKTGGTIPGLGHLITQNTVSPRFGFNLELGESGRSVLRGNYGRFYQGTVLRDFDRFHPGQVPVLSEIWNADSGMWDLLALSGGVNRQEGLDPDLRAPYTDQFSIGFDHELVPSIALGATYVYKRGENFEGWDDTGGIYGTETATLDNGQTIAVYPLLNSTDDRFFLLTTREDFYSRYNGLTLTLTKRWADRWQALFQYTVAESTGLNSASRSRDGGLQNTYANTDVGRDPNSLTNAEGNFGLDITHVFRVQAATDIPKIGLYVGANFQALGGTPYPVFANVLLPQGRQQIFTEPRGLRRLPSKLFLDVRVSKIFSLGERARLEFFADILNAFQETATRRLANRNVFADNFEDPIGWYDPRRALIGAKFKF